MFENPYIDDVSYHIKNEDNCILYSLHSFLFQKFLNSSITTRIEFDDYGVWPDNNRVSLQDDGTLLISNAQLEEDNGKYICSAENKYGKETTSAFVTVTKKGVINSEEKDILLDEGATVVFDCDVVVSYFCDV